ncbi:MAG: RagB/SusD family nutrient uptake outer membrane protein [Gemmatimonadales bacterium]
MRRTISSLAVAAVVLGGCGKLDITNPNTPSQETAALNPRDASIRLIGGVIASYRGARGGLINAFGSYGRETYNMTPQDGRSVTGPYRDWAQNNAFTAGTAWGGPYGNYRNIYEAIKLITNTPDGPITPTEKKGGTGVLKTILALELLHVIEARGSIGAVVDMTDDVNEVHPFVPEDSVYKWITAKLDEAKADLDAAGTSFYFPIPTGFGVGVAANTPAGFGQLNRALKARVEAKRGSLGCGAPCYSAAATAVAASFFSALTATNRDNGVYVVFSIAAGDVLNGISFATNNNLYVHPLFDALTGAAADDRYRRKILKGATVCGGAYSSRTLVSVTAVNRPCTYATNVTPIPIVRNEELQLIRAEARWFTGDQAGAIADLAAVRSASGATNGGTAAVQFATPANATDFTTELLLQRSLSLFQEGHRFPDYRRFGRLATLGTLAQDMAASFTVAPYSVLPSQECDSRSRAGAAAPKSCPGGGT